MRAAALLAVLTVCTACAATARPSGDWRFEGLAANGEIRVVPMLRAYDEPDLRVDGYVTEAIPYHRQVLRQQRMDELQRVPDQVAMAMPGAIHTRLDGDWTGHFRVGHLPIGARARLETALRRHDSDALEHTLSDVAAAVGGEATLFTWITELRANPLTSEAFPGDRVDTAAGSVVVDFAEEPYRVEAEVGMALVSADGHVVLRYTERVDSLLSPHRNASRVGRDLASDLASQVVRMWPSDPRLWCHEPEPVRRVVDLSQGNAAVAPSGLPEVPFGVPTRANAPLGPAH
jgi:hypothetical protein